MPYESMNIELRTGKVSTAEVARALTPGQMAELLGDYINQGAGMGDGREIGREMAYQHRWLQKGVVELLIGILDEMGKQIHCDDRNRHALETCRRISATLTVAGILS